ncbi:MAG TPA: sigma-70 family RNA polymerase sigma factor [Polyangia bacterium]|nr:sigma-70 family RNA polymerase sigma factor [Polyangia bacterium]
MNTDAPTIAPETTARTASEPCPCEEARTPAEADFSGWVTQLVHEHRSDLVAVARREGLAPEDAFDAAQEAFAAFVILPRARALAPTDWAGPTLVALVRNVARNARRLHAVARPHVSDDATVGAIADGAPAADARIEDAEDRGRLARCVGRLAEVQRAVVTLRMLDERPGDDVARALNLAPGHVAVLLHRAKASLRACMTEH